jgi:RNA polymerase sigma factor (sigma-70 family)
MLKTIRPLSEETGLTDECENMMSDFSSEENWIGRENDLVLKKQVRTAIGQLPARQQEVIYLRFFQNLMPEEIAGLLAINSQSVSNIIQRALSNLRGLWRTPPSISVILCSFCQIFAQF